MLEGVNLVFLHDSFLYIALILRVRCQNTEVGALLHFHHLEERFTDIPVLICNFVILVKCGKNSSPLFLERHVHFPDAVNRVGLLPDKLQAGSRE